MCLLSSSTIDPCDCGDLPDFRSNGQRENDSLLESCPHEEAKFEMDAWEIGDASPAACTGCLTEEAETNLWLAEAYFLNGATGLAIECLRAAYASGGVM